MYAIRSYYENWKLWQTGQSTTMRPTAMQKQRLVLSNVITSYSIHYTKLYEEDIVKSGSAKASIEFGTILNRGKLSGRNNFV